MFRRAYRLLALCVLSLSIIAATPLQEGERFELWWVWLVGLSVFLLLGFLAMLLLDWSNAPEPADDEE